MKCNKGQIRGNKRYLLPEVAVLCLSATVVAPSHGMDEFDQQAATVRALIQQETASLLQTLHEPRQAPLSADTATRVGAAPTDPPRLMAIYGVGKGLRATVQWQGQRLHYIQGQTHAQPQLPSAWTLQSLSARCIVLRQEERRHHTCLTR